MHDAIALANLLYALISSTSADIAKIFEEYRAERHSVVMDSFNAAQLAGKMTERGFFSVITLFTATNYAHMALEESFGRHPPGETPSELFTRN
ncbi:hypothetical protein BGZ47_000918 [Haplosporangium gracile]|nr:hypothetical protein BGZ47_000918 [Haplosporangium gracile]